MFQDRKAFTTQPYYDLPPVKLFTEVTRSSPSNEKSFASLSFANPSLSAEEDDLPFWVPRDHDPIFTFLGPYGINKFPTLAQALITLGSPSAQSTRLSSLSTLSWISVLFARCTSHAAVPSSYFTTIPTQPNCDFPNKTLSKQTRWLRRFPVNLNRFCLLRPRHFTHFISTACSSDCDPTELPPIILALPHSIDMYSVKIEDIIEKYAADQTHSLDHADW